MLAVTKVTTVVAAFCIHFVTHGIVYSFGVLFISIDNLFEASKADIAWIGSIATALLFLCGPVTGYLTSRFGCRIVAVTGAVVGFLGYGVSLFVSNLYVLYITMGFVAGCGFGLIYLPAVTSVTRTFSKYRTLAVGLSFCGAGMDESSGAWTVSTIGISSIIGRIALSYVIDRLTIDRTRFMSCALLVGGLVTSLVPVFVPLWSLVLYAVVYGICLGVTVTLLPCVLVDLLGIAKINETLGMTNLFCGTASLIGPPFAGLLFDLTRNYDATFIAAGATQVLAGAMLLFAPLLKNRYSTATY